MDAFDGYRRIVQILIPRNASIQTVASLVLEILQVDPHLLPNHRRSFEHNLGISIGCIAETGPQHVRRLNHGIPRLAELLDIRSSIQHHIERVEVKRYVRIQEPRNHTLLEGGARKDAFDIIWLHFQSLICQQ